jgi:hypothetical protein
LQASRNTVSPSSSKYSLRTMLTCAPFSRRDHPRKNYAEMKSMALSLVAQRSEPRGCRVSTSRCR